MATIALRAYVREIESLIDHNNTDAAIAHCMHILQSMPKHIGTYRMLGKALHEAQRYADAADVFQRVLSVVPDDFVSNVGLSIIRQDEGNLDAAIWHMERAYETQPSNQPIQEELRRLYGRRDGLEPPRVRLTRGALARMYMKGHLYNQATGELRAALAEDPNRADLQVLLAQASYLTGQKVDAVEVCSQLLKKYPYCLEANRLLALILPNTERAKDSEIYRQRVVSLDPYLSKADPNTLVSDSISDAAVMLEKLELLPGQGAGSGSSQPDWATSLGAPFETPEQTELPEWLREEQQPGPGSETEELPQQAQPARRADIAWETSTGELGTDWLKRFEGDEAEALETSSADAEPAIPDWMKAAGWEPAEGGEKEAPVSWEEFEAANGDEIEQGEVPDWLKAIAPGEAATGEAEPPTWLQEKSPGATDTIVNWLNETKSPAPEEDLSGLESALDQVIADKQPADAEYLEEVPDWLRGLESQGPSEGPTTGELHIPEWLQETEPEKPAVVEPTATGLEWLKEIDSEIPEETPALSTVEPIAAEVESEIPDWLKPLEPETRVEPTEDLFSMQTLIAMPPAEDLLSAETLIVQPERDVEPVDAEAADEMPEWLKEMVAETPVEPAVETTVDETIVTQPTVVETTVEETILIQEPVVEKPLPPEIAAAESGLMDEDDALAFLASLAAKHAGEDGWLETVVSETMGEDASVYGTPPKVTPAQPVEEMVPLPIAPVEDVVPLPVAPVEVVVPLPELEVEEVVALPAAPVDEVFPLPEVVVEEVIAVPEPEVEAVEEPAPEAGEAEAIAWLETIAETEETSESHTVTPQPEQPIEPPDWVKSGTISEEETVVVVPSSDEIPDWLKTPSEEERKETQPALVALEADATEMVQSKVDLNTASLSELEDVPGVGFILAQNIIIYRQMHGSIERLEDLAALPGMTEADALALGNYVEINLENPQPAVVTRQLTEPQNETEQALFEARQSVATNNLSGAATSYTSLIKKGQYLPEIIQDLQEVLEQNPLDVNLWQALGDACMRNDQLQEALEAYSHAEELLR